MFQITIGQLQYECSRIEGQVRTIYSLAEELEKVMQAAALMPGMEEIAVRLGKELAQVQKEEVVLRQMLQALDKILLNYAGCEDRILNEFEQNVYSFKPRDVGIFQIPKVSDLIK